MAAGVEVNGETQVVTITDEDGNILGTEDNPLVTTNPALSAAISELIEETRLLRELIQTIFM